MSATHQTVQMSKTHHSNYCGGGGRGSTPQADFTLWWSKTNPPTNKVRSLCTCGVPHVAHLSDVVRNFSRAFYIRRWQCILSYFGGVS